VLPAVRFVRWAALVAVLVAVLVSVALAGRSPSSPQSLSALFGGGTVDTPWGPLGASDRDMLIKVRQADLWEEPASEQAAQRANAPSVREVGRKLGVEHSQLDGDLRAVAAKLGVPLPTQPSDQQKVWMAEITGAAQANYDRTYINLVRSAHGEVMPLVEGVRSGTQNQLVRQFAIEAGEFIGRHMDYLESTGLVDYALFPPSTAPAARLTAMGGYNVPITLVLFVVAVFVSAALLRGLGRTRPGTPPRAVGSGRWIRLASRLDRRGLDGRGVDGRGVDGRDAGGRDAGGRGLGGSGRRLGGSGRRLSRSDQHGMVTTAELIAVLNPPADSEAVAGVVAEVVAERGAVERGAVERGAVRGASVGERAGPVSDRARSAGSVGEPPALVGEPAGSVGEPVSGIPEQRVSPVPRQTRSAPSRRSAASAAVRAAESPAPRPAEWSGELPVAQPAERAHRVVRPGRSAAERTAEQDRRPPKLGRTGAARPW
jgi:predicted outer membrane protein